MLTTQEKINTGFICGYLASNELAGGNKVGGLIDPRLPKLLYAQTMGLQMLYTLDPTNADLEIIGNFLISICKHYAKAQSILGTSGGSISPISGGSSALPLTLDFIVSGSSQIPTGGTTLSLPTFIGFPVNFSRGGTAQYTTNPGDGSSYFSWDIVTGIFSCSPAASVGEQFRISV